MWFNEEPLAWMADNTLKGVSSAEGSAVTIHAAPEFSERHWTTPETEVTRELLQAASRWLGSKPVYTRLHRWRYSHPTSFHPDRCLCIPRPSPMVFAGDGFGGPKVEGAALSGLAAADQLKRALT
jgi:predicted NAD/FAD-dependent oxidoreductase